MLTLAALLNLVGCGKAPPQAAPPDAADAWARFAAAANPCVPPPQRWGHQLSALGRHTLYAATYSQDDFTSLEEFRAFNWYYSSAQQELFKHGPDRCDLAMEWFYPMPERPGALDEPIPLVAAPQVEWQELSKRLTYGPSTSWVTELKLVAAEISILGDELSLLGRTEDEYVVLFTVDDG